MEDYEKMYKTICRVCLCQGEAKSMVSLTDNASQDGLSCYGKAVVTFANVCIKNDYLPQNMCQLCLSLLRQAILFKKKCESSHQKLQNFQRRYNSSESTLKVKLSQFVLFTQYFPEESLTDTSKEMKTKKLAKKVSEEKNVFKKDLDKEEECESVDYNSLLESVFNDSDGFVDDTQNDHQPTDNCFDNMEEIINTKTKIRNDFTTNKNIKLKARKKQAVKRPKQKIKKVKRSSANKDVQCKICSKVLANMSSYKSHMQRHMSSRFICEHCAKKYPTYAELKYHLASSHNVGPHYICKECGFKAPRKIELTEHQRLHTGDRPFSCDKCGLTFRRRFIWKRHSLRHMEKTVQCTQCPQKFFQKSDMLVHCNNVHERVYVYRCNECDVTYAKSSTVRRHLVEKHGVARELQGRINRIRLCKTTVQ